MKCPVCQSTLEQGYLSTGGRPIIWTKKTHKQTAFVGPGERLLHPYTFFGRNRPAYCCWKCRKVILDLDQSKEGDIVGSIY